MAADYLSLLAVTLFLGWLTEGETGVFGLSAAAAFFFFFFVPLLLSAAATVIFFFFFFSAAAGFVGLAGFGGGGVDGLESRDDDEVECDEDGGCGGGGSLFFFFLRCCSLMCCCFFFFSFNFLAPDDEELEELELELVDEVERDLVLGILSVRSVCFTIVTDCDLWFHLLFDENLRLCCIMSGYIPVQVVTRDSFLVFPLQML